MIGGDDLPSIEQRLYVFKSTPRAANPAPRTTATIIPGSYRRLPAATACR
jgi:hypothetical protein